MRRQAFGSVLVWVAMLTACESGGGSLPAIQITSHSDGQIVADGKREIVLTGTGSSMGSVQVKVNGVALPASVVSSSGVAFSATLTLGNNSNTIEAIASNSKGSTSSGVITVRYPFVTFSTFQNASLVLGQKSFGGNGVVAPPAADTINTPIGRALVGGGKLYLADTANNRWLVFDSMPTTNGAAANLVLGQSSFDANGAGSGAAQSLSPQTAADGSGKLLVTDRGNNRILIYNSTPNVSGATPSVVVGWDGLSQPASGGCAPNRLWAPSSVHVAGGKLLVADEGNHRVLIWNSIPTTSGVPASLVLGQTDFTSCSSNQGRAVDGTTLNGPYDVWSDGTRVVVADSSNNRVLVWKTFPTTNGAAADLVVGQADLNSSVAGGAQQHLFLPRSVWSNGNQLFVADWGYHRVVIWNSFPASNGSSGDVVLGQGDFLHVRANDNDQNDYSDPSPTARTLNSPSGVALWGNQLIVTDRLNNRYLVFEGQ